MRKLLLLLLAASFFGCTKKDKTTLITVSPALSISRGADNGFPRWFLETRLSEGITGYSTYVTAEWEVLNSSGQKIETKSFTSTVGLETTLVFSDTRINAPIGGKAGKITITNVKCEAPNVKFKYGTGSGNSGESTSGCGTYNGKQLYKGPEGGCYYYTSGGNKSYVSRSYCNCL